MPANRRRPAIEEARELVALVGALRDNGDTLDAEAVSARLGITPQRAEHMLDLLTQAGGESYANSLPLAADDDSSVTLIASFANTVRGRSVRLTRAEATALDAAFDAMDLDETDDLRSRITDAYYPVEPQVDGLAMILEADETAGIADRLTLLSQAILHERRVEFDYAPVEKATPGTHRHGAPLRRRHVGPVDLRHERGNWYLDAYDLDRRADRVFRVDRMTGLKTGTEGWERSEKPAPQGVRTVRLTFTDPSLLDLFEWPGLRVLDKTDGHITCEIPWYPTGQWLPRHVAACGGGVCVDDPALLQAAAAYAQDLSEVALS